jgi:hypothetical protein
MAVDPYASRYERIEGHHVVDDQGNLALPGADVAELASVGDGLARPSHPEARSVELERERNHVGLPISRCSPSIRAVAVQVDIGHAAVHQSPRSCA